MFDYILTGPISVGQRGPVPGRLLNEISELTASDLPHQSRIISPRSSASLVTLYFWWNNIKGIHESSGKALRIMQITTVMVVAFLIWCPLTLLMRRHRAAAAGAHAGEPALQRGSAGLAQRDVLGADLRRRDDRRVRPLAARHERL